MHKQVLAFSSSKTGNSGYLETASPVIKRFLGNTPLNIAFIPFAATDNNYEAYTSAVRQALPSLYTINTVMPGNAAAIITKSQVIMTGGGNTFKLLHDLYKANIIDLIKEKVNNGVPYIGWSAGTNITGETISTTNDMPVINPGSFDALGFFPFQINPHYYNIQLPGFNGETRDQRLEEFLMLHPFKTIVALPEGTALLMKNGTLRLTGSSNAILFTYKNNALNKTEISPADDLTYLLQSK
jgi:dipeptidase E